MRACLTLGLCLALAAPAWAQDTPPKPAPPAKPAGEEEAKPDEPEPERWFALTHAEIFPGTGGWLHDATLVARDGKIVALGRDVTVPEGAEVLDAAGRRVYPGLVAYDSSGIVGNPPEDATDVYGLNLTLGLAAGLTTVGAGAHVAKLTYGTLEGHTLPPHGQITIDLSTSQARQRLRQDLERVRGYLRDARAAKQAKAQGQEVEEPDRKWLKGRLAGYEQLLKGATRARVRADSAGDLLRVAQLARRFGFRGTVEGGQEAWTVADELGRAGLAVVLSPRARGRADERSDRETGWTIENAATLRGAGVEVAVTSRSKGIGTWGLAGSDLFTLTLEAAFAVRGGLSEDDALAAVTLVPARLLNVDDRVGSLEVGKDCDLLVTSGDLLHYETLVEWSVVNGRIAYDREKDSLLRAIRPRDLEAEGNRLLPQLWPRPEDSEPPAMPDSERD